MPQFFKYDKPYLINRKFKMPAIFILKNKPPKKNKFFTFLNLFYFVMGGPIDMNVGAF